MRTVLLAILTLLAAGLVAAPSALMMIPTRAHTARELEWAYRIVAGTPSGLVVLGVLGLVVAWASFRPTLTPAPVSSPRLARVASVVFFAVLAAASWFSLSRPAENVFAPVTQVSFVSGDAAAADFLLDDDMVLGVTIEGVARAYPVGQLVYHHIVNDVVAGVPIVATF